MQGTYNSHSTRALRNTYKRKDLPIKDAKHETAEQKRIRREEEATGRVVEFQGPSLLEK